MGASMKAPRGVSAGGTAVLFSRRRRRRARVQMERRERREHEPGCVRAARAGDRIRNRELGRAHRLRSIPRIVVIPRAADPSVRSELPNAPTRAQRGRAGARPRRSLTLKPARGRRALDPADPSTPRPLDPLEAWRLGGCAVQEELSPRRPWARGRGTFRAARARVARPTSRRSRPARPPPPPRRPPGSAPPSSA